jgi:dihydropteroate synthase
MTGSCTRKIHELRAREWTLPLGKKTLVMGILNVTPDSFSDKGQYFETGAAVDRAWQIADEGADILDIGGESTRPGSVGISAEEELSRVMPTLEALAAGRKYPIPISVDTTKREVAKAALECGAAIINDISALQTSPEIGGEIARYQAALILMHMRGEPRTMQSLPPSPDILADIDSWAIEAVARARSAGIDPGSMVLDPGIGFGKTGAQNIEILKNLDRLAAFGFPVLVGTSRKSFIGSMLNKPPKALVLGTAATVVASIIYGAHIVRVHDVAVTREIADVADAIVETRNPEL